MWVRSKTHNVFHTLADCQVFYHKTLLKVKLFYTAINSSMVSKCPGNWAKMTFKMFLLQIIAHQKQIPFAMFSCDWSLVQLSRILPFKIVTSKIGTSLQAIDQGTLAKCYRDIKSERTCKYKLRSCNFIKLYCFSSQKLSLPNTM